MAGLKCWRLSRVPAAKRSILCMNLCMNARPNDIETININNLHNHSSPLLAPIVNEARSDAGFVVSGVCSSHTSIRPRSIDAARATRALTTCTLRRRETRGDVEIATRLRENLEVVVTPPARTTWRSRRRRTVHHFDGSDIAHPACRAGIAGHQ